MSRLLIIVGQPDSNDAGHAVKDYKTFLKKHIMKVR